MRYINSIGTNIGSNSRNRFAIRCGPDQINSEIPGDSSGNSDGIRESISAIGPQTVYIDTLGVKTTGFDLDEEKKRALVKSGKEHSAKYFAWDDSPKEAPANRVAE